ncbi:hypothetical protein CISIN_1g043241mg [Citrus sinensis]|uniref:dCTP pyrophosphatase 1 n=1 Tax=Citrus sinensis TaxID=2711 RepID=A0A067F240_CITSI|nr:hypothetical protein CISIN_1g043241mg [Citrus sinensis]
MAYSLVISGSEVGHFRSIADSEEAKNMREGEEINADERVMDISLKDLSKQLEEFAMVGEVGELSEIFQWRGEVDKGLPNWEDADKEHLGEELSDVLLYLIRLADICGIDLGDAATKKIVKNAIKYPPNRELL